jgi:hypothetical protein
MNHTLAKKIGEEIQAAAQIIAARHGLIIVPSRSIFSSTDFTAKTVFKEVVKTQTTDGEDGVTQTTDLLQYARMHGIDPQKTFVSHGIKYTLVDYQRRSRKYPWVAADALGNRMRFTDVTVERHCRITQPA